MLTFANQGYSITFYNANVSKKEDFCVSFNNLFEISSIPEEFLLLKPLIVFRTSKDEAS